MALAEGDAWAVVAAPAARVPIPAGEPAATASERPMTAPRGSAHATSTAWHLVVRRTGSAVVVEVEGDLDSVTSAAVEHVLRDLIEDQGNLEVVVDLHDVGRADAEALAVFLSASRIARQRRAALLLRDAPDAIKRALGVTVDGAKYRRRPGEVEVRQGPDPSHILSAREVAIPGDRPGPSRA